jgi:hypothetical protein
MDKNNEEIEFLKGQCDAQRIAIIALALELPDRTRFLSRFQDLRRKTQEDMIALSVTDQFLEGLDGESRAIETLLSGPARP